MNDSKDQQNHDMKSFKDELESVMERVEEINEKMYDFEANKRNNLIFYGIPNEVKEVQPALLQKITHIIRTSLGIRRDIPVAKVGQDCFSFYIIFIKWIRFAECTQDQRLEDASPL